MRPMQRLLSILGLLAWGGCALAQVSVDVSGGRVSVDVPGLPNVSTSTSGTLGPGVQMQGVAVLNGRVYIDGVEVKQRSGVYVSPKTGQRYRIVRDRQGNVSVDEL